MKKVLLSFIAIAGFIGASVAQCTPDPQYTTPGVYPDSATGLPIAYVGTPYDEVITLVVPADTAYDSGPPFGTVIVDIDYIELTSVTGLPPNFTYVCNPSNCRFPGGSTGCVNLYSTQNPVVNDIGVYNLVINTWNQLAAPYDSFSQAGSYDYYFIEVKDSTGVSAGVHEYTNTAFKLMDIYPNPVQASAKVQFVLGTSEEITFSITNLLGKTMERRTIGGVRGVNTLTINTDKLSDGIYMYSIEGKGKVTTKRMVVNK